jgi:hypothetical protein
LSHLEQQCAAPDPRRRRLWILKVSYIDQRVATRNAILPHHRPVPAAIGD